MSGNYNGGRRYFWYNGGEQVVSRDVTKVRIDKSVKIIPARAFEGRQERLKWRAMMFFWCPSLRRVMKMKGVKEIEDKAFYDCGAMTDLEFNKLEIIRRCAFCCCTSLRHVNMPRVRRVEQLAFQGCNGMMDADFGEDLESIEVNAFYECLDVLPYDYFLLNAFKCCAQRGGSTQRPHNYLLLAPGELEE